MITRVLFICHGNICRSPMAEFIFKKLVSDAGISDGFSIASAATSTEELGNPVYPPVRKELAKHGISADGKTARQLCRKDYDDYDYLIGMDDWNMKNIYRIIGEDKDNKVYKLLTFDNDMADVEDPWYSRKFDKAYSDIYRGCVALLSHIKISG